MEKLIEENEEARFAEMDQEYDQAKGEAVELEGAYLAAKKVVDEYKVRMDEAKANILQLASKGMEFDLITVSEHKRKGNVDMKVLQRKFDIMDSDVDSCRKDEIIVRSIKIKKA